MSQGSAQWGQVGLPWGVDSEGPSCPGWGCREEPAVQASRAREGWSCRDRGGPGVRAGARSQQTGACPKVSLEHPHQPDSPAPWPPGEAWLGSGTGPWWAEWGEGRAQEGWGAGAQRPHVLPGLPSQSHHGPTLTGLPSRERPIPWALDPCRKGTWSQVGMVAGGRVLGVR